MSRLQKILSIVVLIVAFGLGWQAASVRYDRDIAQEHRAYAEKALSLEEQYRERERKSAESLVEAWNARDEALRVAQSERDRSARLHDRLATAERRLSETARDTGNIESERLARCVGFVRRFQEVGSRGIGMARDIAIDKDAIVKITQ